MGVLVVAAIAAACGVPDEGPSNAEFRSRVETICKDSNARVNAIPEMSAADLPSIARGLERTVEEKRVAVSKIRGIATPEGDRAKVDAWLGHADDALSALEAIGTALSGSGDGDVQTALSEARAAESKANTAASELGLPKCASTAAPLASSSSTSTSSTSASAPE